jgi:hypothetical protein
MTRTRRKLQHCSHVSKFYWKLFINDRHDNTGAYQTAFIKYTDACR